MFGAKWLRTYNLVDLVEQRVTIFLFRLFHHESSQRSELTTFPCDKLTLIHYLRRHVINKMLINIYVNFPTQKIDF